ncbi:hypothetical protein JI721_02615 [Alicyclobacillus cycloheptanicus]|uniref:Lipoprotein n=1 Tax=Alicyclobacillus cycloheptanicus TaxID=1457 RepID=A0ABT9XKN4_9BACL|nr:hypothetical protein [Alicyclobacillus cycloheptanicus]MDQ0190871.1 hypothetical protein [Alicyclobacillus cycloheptanicus]WDM01760.1 hypothetical protein JI721_02615 [Alicyclobacillus cycloheptanicus]
MDKMIRHKMFIVLLLLSAVIVSGCATSENAVNTSPPQPDKLGSVDIRLVKTIPVPQEKAQTPADTVRNGVIWTLTNGHTVTAEKAKQVLNIDFQNTAVVDVKVPDVSKWFYIFYLHKVKKSWSIIGVVGAQVFHSNHIVQPLPAPYEHLIGTRTAETGVGTFWLYYDAQSVISMGNIKISTEYPLPKGKRVTLPNGQSATLVRQNGVNFVYYPSSPGRFVWIGGNVPYRSILQLAGNKDLSFTQTPLD